MGLLRDEDGSYHELGPPKVVDYRQAEAAILDWQAEHAMGATIIALDQPTIVRNAAGQRPVENLVGSPVSLRYGGVQPANTSKQDMFGPEAPVWRFLERFGGAADPLAPSTIVQVFETYPVLVLIAQGWLLPDTRPTSRLPKYNPERRPTFSIVDWQYVCQRVAESFRGLGLDCIARWLEEAGQHPRPTKRDQDSVDACLCLLVSIHLAGGKDCLMVGNVDTGYIVVPDSTRLRAELVTRCDATGRSPSDWVRVFRLSSAL